MPQWQQHCSLGTFTCRIRNMQMLQLPEGNAKWGISSILFCSALLRLPFRVLNSLLSASPMYVAPTGLVTFIMVRDYWPTHRDPRVHLLQRLGEVISIAAGATAAVVVRRQEMRMEIAGKYAMNIPSSASGQKRCKRRWLAPGESLYFCSSCSSARQRICSWMWKTKICYSRQRKAILSKMFVLISI